MTEVVIGMLGFGVVGGGTVKLLRGVPGLRIKRILVRDLIKRRSAPTPPGCQLTTDLKEILEDPDINLLVEVMGGTDLAWTATKHALSRGIHVTSANKALISKYMAEIEEILEQKPSTMFMFEAAVCGGIPIVASMQRSMIRDDVTAIKGIMNGTSNFMLTKMIKEGSSYEEALVIAKERGYAEADPSADVLGWDARSKLCILSKIAYGCTVDEGQVYTEGIGRIQPCDIKAVKQIDCCIKLMGISQKVASKVTISCSPVVVPLSSALASVEWVTNGVQVNSQNLDIATFIGPGAGELPSANSVVNDVMSMLRHFDKPSSALPAFPTSSQAAVDFDFVAPFYIRTFVEDRSNFDSHVRHVLQSKGVKVKEYLSLLPDEMKGQGHVALITERCSLSQVKTCCESLHPEKTVYLRYDDV